MEVEAEVEKREIEIKERDDVISRLEGERVELMGELNEQKLRLQYFVDSVSHFVPGENEHLVDKRGTRPYIPDVTPVIEGTDR